MKATALFFIIAITFYSCYHPQPIKDDPENDSIFRADSIRKAYENRPWKIENFIDDFGDNTDSKYIYTNTVGVFSNSATSNSPLFVKIIITKNTAGIFLHPYSPDNPAEKFIGQGKISMKNEFGELKGISSIHEWNDQGGLLIVNTEGFWNYYSDLVSFIKKSKGEIKFVISDQYSSKYNFSISADGFSDELNRLKN